MKELTLVVDERELSTIKAALLLLQEQIDVLPEDIAEMLQEHGRPMNEIDIDQFSRRLGVSHEALGAYPQKDATLLGYRPPQL
jgi:hypothetical protein